MALDRLADATVRLKSLIARKRATARVVIAFERLWVLALPALCVGALFVSLAWFGYFRASPDWLRIITVALFAAGFMASLSLLRRFRMPTAAETDRRLETANVLDHQAVTVQSDRLESRDVFSRALWAEHQRRMAERIESLDVGLPRPDTPRRDPFGARALVVLLLVTAFGYSYSNQSGRLGDAFVSHAVSNAPATRIDAWVTPPDYTGRAPIFLTASDIGGAAKPIDVPEGSEIVVRVSGGIGEETVTFAPRGGEAQPVSPDGGSPVEPATLQTNAAQGSGARGYTIDAAESGTLSIASRGAEPKSWRFAIVEDSAPTIAFVQDPRRAVNGALEIAFASEDDYGVERAHAEIEPLDASSAQARPLYEAPEYRLGLPRRGAREAEATASHDLTDHPWSGTRVRITLVAEDAAGQVGRSEPREMVMPSRGFSEPLARAVVEQRQVLALNANDIPRVLLLNDAVTTAPEETIDDLAHFLLLKSARARIVQAFDDEMLRDAADHLWEIALGIEDGDLSLAERRLRDAQRELAEALQNGATDEEIQALMEELREAMQEYMQALADEMRNSDQAMQIPENALDNLLRQEDLNSIMDQIENLARQGARDEAQQLLSELQRMMNNLQAGRRQPMQGNSEMRQQMDQLGELMREQQQLMDETFRLDQELQERMQQGFGQQQQQQPGQQGENGQQGQLGQDPGDMTREQLEQALRQLREQQEQLGQQLSELQEQLEGMGIEPGEGFGQAGEAMGDAARSLGEGRGEQAVGEQGQALQALREGAQDMMNQMMQAMGQGQGEGQGQGPAQMRSSQTDPLGRPRSTEGPDFGDSVEVPDEADIQRAREILDAIRNRLGNALSPAIEKQYLERLLDLR